MALPAIVWVQMQEERRLNRYKRENPDWYLVLPVWDEISQEYVRPTEDSSAPDQQ